MLNFNTKEDKFHKMISEAAIIVEDGANILRRSLDDLENIQVSATKIESLEHRADKLVIKVTQELNKAFITPIDREDIYSIVMGLEKIIDSINSAIHRFVMFDIKKATLAALKMSDLIVEASAEIVVLMEELKLIGKKNNIKEKVIKINELEREGDITFRKIVGELFRNEINPIEIIKWKEVYQILENIMDDCERVANTVEGIVMKNA